MTRKFALAAIATAALAAAPMFATEASARDGRRTNAAIGFAAGIGGALLGAAIINARQPRTYVQQRFVGEHHGYRHVSYDSPRYHADEEVCFDKPIRRVDRFTGRVITVGSRTVCR